jgi:hypothetical protein
MMFSVAGLLERQWRTDFESTFLLTQQRAVGPPRTLDGASKYQR